MAGSWRPVRGVFMKVLGNGLILFSSFISMIFFGSWRIGDQSLILMQQLKGDQQLEDVILTHVSFWVQVHGLPSGFMSEKVAQAMGNFVGVFEKADPRNFDGGRKDFMRVRVRLDRTQPLKRRMKLKRQSGEWFLQSLSTSAFRTFVLPLGVLVMLNVFAHYRSIHRRMALLIVMVHGFGLAAGEE